VAIILGLLAAACYGAADFFGGSVTRRSSIVTVAFLSQGAGLALLLCVVPFLHGHPSERAFLYGAAGGLCGGIGIALLYHALSIAKMGVISPVTAVLAAALPVGVGVASGERISLWQDAGIGIALVAIVLISITTQGESACGAPRSFQISTIGLKEAIMSGFFLGGFYIFLARAGTDAGLYPVVSARFISTALLFVGAVLLRKPTTASGALAPVIILIGGLDVLANCLYVLASYAGYLSIAAVLTSLYPASTVFLARFLLGEHLSVVQKIGVALALGGVALIAS
jgi:drug/metabolite transporter (DMT)-like permease